jgi:hypothetical protein
MSVVIRNKPSIEKKDPHYFYEYYGFVDSQGDFFLITANDSVVLMDDNFEVYNVYHKAIEDFLAEEFTTTLVRAYKKNDFDILIDLK